MIFPVVHWPTGFLPVLLIVSLTLKEGSVVNVFVREKVRKRERESKRMGQGEAERFNMQHTALQRNNILTIWNIKKKKKKKKKIYMWQ